MTSKILVCSLFLAGWLVLPVAGAATASPVPPVTMTELRAGGTTGPATAMVARAGHDTRTTHTGFAPTITGVEKAIVLVYHASGDLVLAARVRSTMNAPVLRVAVLGDVPSNMTVESMTNASRIEPVIYPGVSAGQVLLYPLPAGLASPIRIVIEAAPSCPANSTASFPTPAGEVLHGSPPVLVAAGSGDVPAGVDWEGVLSSISSGGYASLVNVGDLTLTAERLKAMLSTSAFAHFNVSNPLGSLAGDPAGTGEPTIGDPATIATTVVATIGTAGVVARNTRRRIHA